MTTEIESTAKAIEEAAKAVTEAESALVAVQAAADKEMPELLKAGDYAKMGETAAKVTAAKANVERAKAAHAKATTDSYWAKAEEMRRPTLDILRTLLVDNAPSAPVVAVRGIVTIKDDGTSEIALRAEIGSLDLSEIESFVAETINGAAYAEQGIKSIDVNVTNIGKADATVSLLPSANVTSAAKVKVTGSGRSGDNVYTWNNIAYGAKDFLAAVEAAGHQIATDRKQGFETALRGNGNGLSNLAKAVAPKVGATISEKAAEAAPAAPAK